MDDIGEPIESTPEFFSCIEKAPLTLPRTDVSENCANLLACSSRFGYAVIASNVTLSVIKLVDIRETRSSTIDLDLSDQRVQTILSIQFIMGDTVLLVHAESKGAELFLLNFPALVSGKVQTLSNPVAAITYGAFSEPNPATTPSSQLIATLTSAVHVYNLSATSCEPTVKIDIPGPLSLAFSPSDALLAVGTQRGCVYIHFTSDASLATTITEVESGWIPFAVHFVREDSVLVTYSKEDNTLYIRYILWTLELNGRDVSVASHFPFGELCLPSPDVSSDQHPNVVFNNLTSWDMCIITSSISTQAEIVAKVGNEWQVWKLDEGKSVDLPITEDGDDTFPLGSAIDFTDDNPIEPDDPSSDMIQPMPRFLVLTSEFTILPFSLIDARAGAKCDFIRAPSALPQPTELGKPVEQIMFPDFTRQSESSSGAIPESTLSSSGHNQIVKNKESLQPSATTTTPFSKTSDVFGFSELSKDLKTTVQISDGDGNTKDESESETVWAESTNVGKSSFFAQSGDSSSFTDSHHPYAVSESNVKPHASSNVAEMPQRYVFSNDDSTGDGNDGSEYQSSALKVPSSQAFSGAGTFLSQFYTEEKKEYTQGDISSTAETGRARASAETPNIFPEQPRELARREPESVSLQPSLEQALKIASTGEGIDLIRSILYEMSEELTTNRKAGEVLTAELRSQSHALLSRLEATRSALSQMLDSTMVRFHKESVLRKEVSETLKHILRISRAYETLALELQVEDATGLSRSLKPEDIAMDEQISNKEAEVVKSLASIEGRLAEETTPKTYKNSAGVVREIYSSLSLQGIRIRRVSELLSGLSQRLEGHDQGGRQSSLGLSLARLEQLSLEEIKSPRTPKTDGDQSWTVGTLQTPTDSKMTTVDSSPIPEEGHELFPPNIDALLRKLAMSGGREQISTLAQQVGTDSGLVQRDPTSSREVHKDIVSSRSDKTGESQIADVRKLLDTVNHSSRKQPANETRSFSTSSVLRPMTATTSDMKLTSLHETPSTKKKPEYKQEEGWQVPPRFPDSLSSVKSTMPKSSGQRSKIGCADVFPEGLDETTLRGIESKPVIDGRESNGVFSSFGASVPLHRESEVGSSSLQNDKARSQPEMSSPFASGQLQARGPAPIEPSSNKELTTLRLSSDGSRFSAKGGFTEEKQKVTLSASPIIPTNSAKDSHRSANKNNRKGIPFASLPPEDFDSNKESLKASAPFTSVPQKTPFASLPPDDFSTIDIGSKKTEVQFASLPPDNFSTTEKSSKKTEMQFASLPPDDFSTTEESSKKTEVQSASLPPGSFSTAEESSKKAEVQFASLPPDEDEVPSKLNQDKPVIENKILEVTGEQSNGPKTLTDGQKGGTVNTAEIRISSHGESASTGVELSPFEPALKPPDTIQTGFLASQPQQSAELPKPDSNTSFFGTMGSPVANTIGSSPFGQLSSQEENKGNDVFGMGGLLASTAGTLSSSSFQTQPSASNQEGTSMFGAAMQMNRPNDGNRSGRPPSPIAATESDDSDDENLRQGMDTSMGVSNNNGSQGFSSQSAASGSLFGQAFSSAFGTPNSGSQVFGQSSPQVGSTFGVQQMSASLGSFGTPGSNAMGSGSGLNSSPFGANPSFGVASRIGGAPAFGAPSAIGTPSTFGNASSIGAQGSPFAMPSPRFGESTFGNQSVQSASMLGFGVSSAGTASASPFGALATGTGFGQSAGSASGFAALAANSNGLVFGNGGGPPAFTSAAFTQRRA